MVKILKINDEYLDDAEEVLIQRGFEPSEGEPEKYLIRYIPDVIDWFDKGGGMDIDTPYYRTLYFDREKRELFAYHDYMDEVLEMKDEWIEDIRFLFYRDQDYSIPML